MKELLTFMKILKYLCLFTITGCVVYLAMWFDQYQPMIM